MSTSTACSKYETKLPPLGTTFSGINQLAVRLQNPMVAHSSTQTLPVPPTDFTNPSLAKNILTQQATHKKWLIVSNQNTQSYSSNIIRYPKSYAKLFCLHMFLSLCVSQLSHASIAPLGGENVFFLCILQLRAYQCIFTLYISIVCLCVSIILSLAKVVHMERAP